MFYTEEQLSMIVSVCQELAHIDRVLMKEDFFKAEEPTPDIKALWKREDELCDWLNRYVGEAYFAYTDTPSTIVRYLERL